MFANIDPVILRLSAFIGVFVAMALLEFLIPKRSLNASKTKRWTANLTMAALNSFFIRLMSFITIPLIAMSAAALAEKQGWGLFNLTDWPFWLECLLAIIILDLAIYAQHVASHKIPILWQIHQVHHSDRDIDVSTGIRFHPIEISLSMLYKVVLVLLLGPAVFAVFLFEVLLNGCAMFNHANIALPKWMDWILRSFIVTPDMHRVHHSTIKQETDSNYGFNFSIWDRVFGTYKAEPQAGHQDMEIGLEQYQTAEPTKLKWLLMLPFSKKK